MIHAEMKMPTFRRARGRKPPTSRECLNTQEIKFNYYITFNRIVARLSNLAPNKVTCALPDWCMEECKHISDTRDIFMFDSPIYEEFQWYDLTLLENIVNKVGANECKRNLEDYKVYLKGYISSRMIEDTSNSDVSPVYRITIDAEWDSAFMKEEEAPKNYLAHLLNVQEDFLFFDPCLAS